jgi:hypothetical protein
MPSQKMASLITANMGVRIAFWAIDKGKMGTKITAAHIKQETMINNNPNL